MDEREKLLKTRNEYFSLEGKLHDTKVNFTQIGCRYRSETGYACDHQRHMLKKYPQHQPAPPLCSPDVCPRN